MMGKTFKCLGLLVLIIRVAPGLSQEPQHFSYKHNTGNNAVVVIPASAVPSIENIPLEVGDEIGAFTPSNLCVGALVWGNENITLTIWGDDPTTFAVDGLHVGEQIFYRVWSHREKREYQNVEISYQLDASGDGTYLVNGLYEIQSLNAVRPLQPPELFYPQDGDTLFGAGLLNLSWGPASKAELYQLDVSKDSTFSSVQSYMEYTSDTTFSMPDLTKGAIYYWKVRSISETDTSRWSGIWSFVIESAAPRLGVIPSMILHEDTDTTLSVSYLEDYVKDPNTMFANLTWHFSVDSGLTIVQTKDLITIIPEKDWSGKTTILVSVSDGTNTDSTRWQIEVLPVNDAPMPFNLIIPENKTDITLTSKNIRDSVILAWEKSTDPDTDSLRYFLDVSPSLSPYLEMEPIGSTETVLPLLDVFYHLRQTENSSLTIHWDVGATDGMDTTYSSNGPFILNIRNDYFDTTQAKLQVGLIQNQYVSDSTTIFLRASEPLASNPIMIFNSESLTVVNENADDMERFHSALDVTRNGDYDILIRAQDLSLNETRLNYHFTRQVLAPDSARTFILPGQSVETEFSKGSVKDRSTIYFSPMEIYDFAKLEDLYPGIENKPQGGKLVSIFQIESTNEIVKPFTLYTTREPGLDQSLTFYRLTAAGWERMLTFTGDKTGKIWSTADNANIYALFEEAIISTPATAELLLLESYPNPFRTNITIRYSIPVNQTESQQTSVLNIYNIQGRIVRTLVHQPQSPGNYSTTWNGTDDKGRTVSSGVYICLLKVGNQWKSHKMTFLK